MLSSYEVFCGHHLSLAFLAKQNVKQSTAEVNGNVISFAGLDHTDLMMGLQKKSEEKDHPSGNISS